MHRITFLGVAVAVSLFAATCQVVGQPNKNAEPPIWTQVLDQRLPTYGHRNWIVIADSAYPSQSRPGIETLTIDGAQLDAVQQLLEKLEACKHVRPQIYVDSELTAVDNNDAMGIEAYRMGLNALLGSRKVNKLPHEQIIDRLDKAAEKFHVLILKTDLALPYTSVFVELECGYWSEEQEARLREAIGKQGQRP